MAVFATRVSLQSGGIPRTATKCFRRWEMVTTISLRWDRRPLVTMRFGGRKKVRMGTGAIAMETVMATVAATLKTVPNTAVGNYPKVKRF